MSLSSKSRTIIEKITFGALFASIAIVMKLFITFETMQMRISIFEVPIVIAGTLLGPIYGGFVGFITDVVYMMINIRGFNVGFNLFTIENITYGLLPGLFFYFYKYTKVKLSIIIIITMIIAFALTTTQLYIWVELGKYPPIPLKILLFRIFIYIIKIPIQIYLIHIFVTYKSFLTFSIFKRFNQKHNIVNTYNIDLE